MKQKPTGGPRKESFYRENVTPVNFSNGDPFWDLGAVFATVEKRISNDELTDILIIERRKITDSELKLTWRGKDPRTTALGMLEWAKFQLMDNF